ncbi:MAG: YcxB family protein [Bacilli bacterium]|nr:YcxB family protein [Bacilli bacterium]
MIVTTVFNNTDQEIKDFFTYHLFTRQKSKYIYLGFISIFLVLGLLFFFVWEIEMFAVFVWIAGFFWGFYWPLSIKKVVKKIIKEGSLKTPPQRLVISNDSIKREIDKYTQTYTWDKILFVVSKKKYYYFYISKNSALICNKTRISNNEVEDIKKLILENKIKIKKI